MYPVSEAYKAAIMTSAVHHIRGSVRLTNGTSITVTDELIGDICRSMQCLNDSSVFGIGGVYQGQLIFSLVADSIERNSLYGAEVNFDFGLEISADTTEWVPLGVLYIAKAVRNENQINCTAYDRMSELDTDMLEASMKYNYAAGLVPYQAATVYSLVTLATGLEFEQTFDEIKAMTDVPLDLMYGVRGSAPKSLRTAVSQLAELIGGFAFINRSGKIEFRQFKSAEPVYTILPNRRFKLELAEQPFTVSGVSYTKATGEYTESVSGNSGYIVHFESNGLMANDNDSTDYEKWICSLIHNILNLTFTPGTLEYAGDPALDVGDFVNVTLTGDTSLECLFILYGATSRNGKGTTMETFLQIVGDYGKTSNPEMLSTKFGNTNASGPSEEIARLAGIRFVNISEPEKKITFNAALVKRMTGNDTLNARFLHENSFDFKPNFKIFINTNYKPSVSDMTLFYSCRLKLIPFKRHFEEHEQDKGLKAFFAEEPNLSAIFNWCYEGYKCFRAEGLEDPAAVTTATKEYEAESDRVGQFVDAWLEEGEAFEVRTSAVYKLYGEWCDKYGYRKENSTNFNNAIQRFFPIVRKRPNDTKGAQKTTMLVGCRFLDHENGEEDKPEEFAALE